MYVKQVYFGWRLKNLIRKKSDKLKQDRYSAFSLSWQIRVYRLLPSRMTDWTAWCMILTYIFFLLLSVNIVTMHTRIVCVFYRNKDMLITVVVYTCSHGSTYLKATSKGNVSGTSPDRAGRQLPRVSIPARSPCERTLPRMIKGDIRSSVERQITYSRASFYKQTNDEYINNMYSTFSWWNFSCWVSSLAPSPTVDKNSSQPVFGGDDVTVRPTCWLGNGTTASRKQ